MRWKLFCSFKKKTWEIPRIFHRTQTFSKIWFLLTSPGYCISYIDRFGYLLNSKPNFSFCFGMEKLTRYQIVWLVCKGWKIFCRFKKKTREIPRTPQNSDIYGNFILALSLSPSYSISTCFRFEYLLSAVLQQRCAYLFKSTILNEVLL